MKQKILDCIDKNGDALIALSSYLYQNPEVSENEHKACEALTQFLEKRGFAVSGPYCNLDTAFFARKQNGKGPKIALLCEYDALESMGHACGHHLIAGMSMGAFIALAEALSYVEGEVAIIGSPAEEMLIGKIPMIDAGVFKQFDMAMMTHPFHTTSIYPPSQNLGGYSFRFYGKSAHAGTAPYEGVNALDALMLFYNAINAMRQQLPDFSRVHGIVLEAGKAVNIVPGFSHIHLELRARTNADYEIVLEKVLQCARGAALSTGCTMEYAPFEPLAYALNHNHTLGELYREQLHFLGMESVDIKDPLCTDMGNVSMELPSIHPMLSITDKKYGLHTEAFLEAGNQKLAYARMLLGAKAMALTGLAVFENPHRLDQAREEFCKP